MAMFHGGEHPTQALWRRASLDGSRVETAAL